MRTILIAVLTVMLVSCSNPSIQPRLSTDIKMKRRDAGTVVITVHVKNDGDRATVPIDVAVTTATGQTVIHPAAFVLNHQEVRELKTSVNTAAAVQATLTVKEAERGLVVVTQTATVE